MGNAERVCFILSVCMTVVTDCMFRTMHTSSARQLSCRGTMQIDTAG